MGNLNSQSGPLNIVIQTEKQFYYSGENITGNIFINCTSQYKCLSLSLKIKGIEQCQWMARISVTVNNNQDNEILQGKSQIINQKFPIYQFPGLMVLPGQYNFPFQFLLPNQIPGSIDLKGKDWSGSIAYYIKAYLDLKGKNKAQLKSKQILVVREQIPKNIQQKNEQKMEKVVTCCCFDQGYVGVKSFLQTDTFLPGEEAIISSEIDNTQGKLKIKSINLKLQRTIQFTANQRKFAKSITINEIIKKIQLPGLENGNKKCENDAILSKIQLSDYQNKPVQPSSTLGNILFCKYNLIVEAEVDGIICFCHKIPQTITPINIVQAPPIEFSKIQQPDNWTPQVFPLYLAQVQNQINQKFEQQNNQIQKYQQKNQINDNLQKQNLSEQQTFQSQIYPQQQNYFGETYNPEFNNQLLPQNLNQQQRIPESLQMYHQQKY